MMNAPHSLRLPARALMALVALATACAADPEIGLSVLTLNNPFFKDIAEAMTAEAAKQHFTVIAVSGDLDVARQQSQVKDFIVRKVAAIVLCPCDSKAIGPVIREANAAGIPVFTVDIACLDPLAKVACHVATDNYQGGRMAAEAMGEAVPGGGTIVILEHPEVESSMMRVKGFEDRLRELNEKRESKLAIVAKLPGMGDRAKSYKATQDALQAHPDLKGIFACNDPSALGVRAALETSGKADQVRIIGFDGQPEGKQAIAQGKIYADAIQFPQHIGAEVARAIGKYMLGETVPPTILIPTALYRQADAQQDATLKR